MKEKNLCKSLTCIKCYFYFKSNSTVQARSQFYRNYNLNFNYIEGKERNEKDNKEKEKNFQEMFSANIFPAMNDAGK